MCSKTSRWNWRNVSLDFELVKRILCVSVWVYTADTLCILRFSPNSHVSGMSSTCINVLHQSWTKNSSFFLYCVCLGLKYALHLFVNQKLKKTIKLDQLQRHGHKLSLTSASKTHSFHLAFEITKASNTHTQINECPKAKWATKLTCSLFYSTQSIYKS